MKSLEIVLKEIRQRKLSALLVVLAVGVATATVLTVAALNRALSDEFRRLTRDMGTNLIIFPADAQLERYFHGTEPDPSTLPQEYIDALLALKPPIARHIVGRLLTSVRVEGRQYVLAGTSPEYDTAPGSKSQLGMVISPGAVHVGAVAAEELGWREGQAVTIEDRTVQVERILPPLGSRDDFTIFAPLEEVQNMLAKPGEVSVVEALGCLCAGDYLATVKRDIEAALPNTHVVSLRSRALARVRVRQSVAAFGVVLSVVVVALSAVGGASVFLVNVRERRSEIGILMAMGCQTGRIVWLFLLKGLVLAIGAALLAFVSATALIRALPPRVVGWKAGVPTEYLLWAGGFALGLGVMVSLPAVWRLCRLDPADVLREM